ncbi:hypothetical protein B5M42_000810 [Paenibacillus athensensis]|uniref:Uncharacterized protein n=1 Tax=Paenibacillus athensensis TaxID=1967502 RepID=A0A4Y8Q7T8_9BACL|nr:hypothetical protein [Paenibacillus athensensis]MCD1257375.1 hypothetical protein [Paenibacillus athensensis]
MNEWPAALWASISAMAAALVLALIAVLGSFARQGAAIQQTDDNAIAIVKEYRKYEQFDGTKNLYAQDVISAIAESRGNPEIWVDKQPGVTDDFSIKFTKSTSAANFSTKALTADENKFPVTARYDSKLIKDANGAIIRIEFRRP